MDADNYPEDHELATIWQWPIPNDLDWRPLIDYVRERWRLTDPPKPETIDGHTYYTFHTGGWSGNESLIRALADNALFWSCCWVQSHRGGKHVFRLTPAAQPGGET